ncbi:MAG: protein kinase [Phycisphaerales bacterium]|nr:protein kinase [Phycisphaerales bacterium]
MSDAREYEGITRGTAGAAGGGSDDEPTALTAPPLQRIGEYRIERVLGYGGMGVVYRAHDPRLGRTVAIKILRPERTTDELRRRFHREARAAAQLTHPNIATVHELGETDDGCFIAMEFIDGLTLREVLLREGRLAPVRALDIAIQILEGLCVAHAHNIVHRDLKPQNIAFTADGRVKILDFGLAKILEAPSGDESSGAGPTTELTVEHRVMGTVGYMSPEQARGRPVDARSDLFSFGVLVYEMVTAAVPFPGSSATDVLSAIIRDAPVPPRKKNPDVPVRLDRLIGRCLEKEAGARPQTARDLLSEVRELREALTRESAEELPSIAVLPFANMSADPENEYLADGIAGEIINALSKIQALRVVSRTSSFAFKGRHEDIRKIGEQLGVRSVLEGTVQKAGKRLRIMAHLVNVDNGYQLWSDRFDRDVEDIFAIQDEIADSITRAMRIVLTEQEKRAIEKVPTENVKAYDFYLRGRQFFYQFRRKGWEFAQPMFKRAIEIDPGFALAYAAVADCCSMLHLFSEASESLVAEADEASRRALELDPELAEAHVARAVAQNLRGDFEEARRQFTEAIRLDPRLYDAYHFFARACFSRGLMDEAADLFEKSWQVRPEDYFAPMQLAAIHRQAGREADASRMTETGLAVVRRRLELNPDDARAMCFGAIAHSELGDRPKAIEWTRRASAMDPEDPLLLYNIGCVYTLLGETESAIDCLESAVDNGMGQRGWFTNDPDLEPIRGHPRFQALLDRMEYL